MLSVVAILCPPVAVALTGRGSAVVTNLGLTALLYVPGAVHAWNVVNRYRTSMIDKTLEVCDATRPLPPEHRFVWTLSGWPMTQILWPGQTPDRRGRIEQAIRDGRLVWHALPGSLHTESLDLEDIVRGRTATISWMKLVEL